MTPNVIIEQRVYDYAKKHDLLNGFTFSPYHIRTLMEKKRRTFKPPKYFIAAISYNGMEFASLRDFPCERILRVCKESTDGTFRIGDLVWRDEPHTGVPDGINFIQDASCLRAESCDKALQGARFE